MPKIPGIVNIIGLGNILAGDDGFGVLALEQLAENYDFPPNARLIDGGTQGLSLYPYLEEAEKLLILDAADFGEKPGAIISRRLADIPLWLGARKLSPHQNSFSELLALAFLKNTHPCEAALVGVQPLSAAFGEKLSEPVAKSMEEALKLALGILGEWGIFPARSVSHKTMLNRELAKRFNF